MYRDQHERKCPTCNEWISATAPKCFNCGEYVTDDEDDDGEEVSARPRIPFNLLAGSCIAVIGMGVAVSFLWIK